MIEWEEEEVIHKEKINSLSVRKGTIAEIKALVPEQIDDGDVFYETTYDNIVVNHKADGEKLSIVMNTLEISDDMIGNKLTAYKEITDVKVPTMELGGANHQAYVAYKLTTYPLAGLAQMRVTTLGNVQTIAIGGNNTISVVQYGTLRIPIGVTDETDDFCKIEIAKCRLESYRIYTM